MSSYLHITTGPLKGSKIRLRDNLTLGRNGANVNLKDPKVSNIHAKITTDSSGQWEITDMNSRNGTYHNDQRVQHLVLKEGMSIRMGDHLFLFRSPKSEKPRDAEIHTKDLQPSQSLVRAEKMPSKLETQQVSETPSKPLKTQPKEAQLVSNPLELGAWRQSLSRLCQEIRPYATDRPQTWHSFTPPLSLKIIQGIQVNTQWYLGYGPRAIGSSSLDLRLFEAQTPDCAFELHPHSSGAIIKTQYPKMVQLNGRKVSSKRIRDGDIVSINETHIQINFLT